ncbi:uncharacterized protein EDB93DRAFT_1322318 [Suillus bovinus]|uniref:uncharacterized protein n=1 Tax=Suillus bovinus TaxID=48563 RepID=UPI001B874B3A|nr:uncharacterized protein EDB93DRAFT_1322318 [Suillus bovinus]KAG2138604.1 hypothetical protein EDB93DRAFT_1322318 [Suillus bovinus]
MPAMVAARGPSTSPPAPAPPPHKRSTNYGYYIPMDGGGEVQDTYPAGLGEPINVIISAYSDSQVLQNTLDNGGLINYFQSFGFSTECLGQTDSSEQMANLGDGNGYLNETAVIRWDYGDANLGTCQETVEGGNHFRYWIQNGQSADSGAIFMATSYEMPIADSHNIIVNGYNLGRDWLVGNATSQSTILPTANMTDTSTYSGQTSFNNYTYATTATYVSGLLQNTSDGINHYQSVAVNGLNAIDGLVAILTVKMVNQPGSSSSSSGAEGIYRPKGLLWTLLAMGCAILVSSL